MKHIENLNLYGELTLNTSTRLCFFFLNKFYTRYELSLSKSFRQICWQMVRFIMFQQNFTHLNTHTHTHQTNNNNNQKYEIRCIKWKYLVCTLCRKFWVENWTCATFLFVPHSLSAKYQRRKIFSERMYANIWLARSNDQYIPFNKVCAQMNVSSKWIMFVFCIYSNCVQMQWKYQCGAHWSYCHFVTIKIREFGVYPFLLILFWYVEIATSVYYTRKVIYYMPL